MHSTHDDFRRIEVVCAKLCSWVVRDEFAAPCIAFDDDHVIRGSWLAEVGVSEGSAECGDEDELFL